MNSRTARLRDTATMNVAFWHKAEIGSASPDVRFVPIADVKCRACKRPSWQRRHWMLEEEAQHLPRGVRPSRIGVGAGGAASRPSVSRAMDIPLFKDCPPARVAMDRAGIGMSSGYPTAMHLPLQIRGPPPPVCEFTASSLVSSERTESSNNSRKKRSSR